ncbi:MAG: type II secretion system protein GspD [bacterium]
MRRLICLLLLIFLLPWVEVMADVPVMEKGLQQTIQKSPSNILITNVFVDTELRQALRDISAQAGVNIIADNTIQGWITADLKNVPLEKALEIVLAGGGYTYKWMGDYYLVGLPDIKNATFNSITTTEHIKIKYLDARSVAGLLSDFYTPYIKVDPLNNTITVTSSKEIIERIKRDITNLDKPRKQVIIEGAVVELSESGGQSLEGSFGIKFPIGEPTTTNGTVGLDYSYLGGIVFNLDSAQKILLKLKALVEEGKAKVKASPKISTLDGKEASIELGREEYVIITTGTETTLTRTLQMIKGGIILKILPRVIESESNEPNDMFLTISTEVSDIQMGVETPTALRRIVSTTIRIKDNQTVVIGGLKQENEREVVDKVPILGDIPILGNLFSNKRKTKETSDIVILLTCKIVSDLESPK